jgi:hypothetical protein
MDRVTAHWSEGKLNVTAWVRSRAYQAGVSPDDVALRGSSFRLVSRKEDIVLRGLSIALGIGLVVLFMVGLGRNATPWLTWMDGVAALGAFAIAAGALATSTSGGGAVIGLGLLLGVLWILGLSTHAVLWLTWWTFAFSCAFLLVGLVASVSGPVSTRTTQMRPA